jgi:hypothetical protein
VVLGALGSVTYLASSGDITGSDALIVITSVVTAVTGVTAAHVAGQTAATAFNTLPAPAAAAPPPAQAPAGLPVVDPVIAAPGG